MPLPLGLSAVVLKTCTLLHCQFTHTIKPSIKRHVATCMALLESWELSQAASAGRAAGTGGGITYGSDVRWTSPTRAQY